VAASEALFGQGDLAALDAATLRSALAELPQASGGPATPIAQLLLDAGLTSSLGESRRAIEQGGVYVNNERVDDTAAVLG
ncbi:S4 domain-containing protein, partial [Mesorhizobium japonicum]|uniref:S4 domain-containing protein n=1 Tax=Mesorhizobium japonicum TaxID=2066070 RepID=UPI003B5CE4DC